jgi:hypothetical protein
MTRPAWFRIPTNPVGQFVFFGLAEFVSFFVISANFRAIAIGNYYYAGATDFMTLIQNFAIGKLMMDDERMRTWYVGLGAAVGGTLGTLFSIYVTKHLYGQ